MHETNAKAAPLRRRSSTRALLAWPALGFALPCAAFAFHDVAAQAQALARRPWQAAPPLPPALAGLSYDDYRRLRFKPARAVWREQGLPFELQFFAAARGFTQRLRLHEVVDGEVRPLRVPRSAFEGGGVLTTAEADGADAADVAVDVAGFRVHHPLNATAYKDELIAFLGASYFRALGAGQRYGLSARALAVDTVGGSGEEFPAFTAFWFERPAADARELTIHALLDGPRVAGAWRFVVRPGGTTVVDVRARLWLRAPVAMLGIAPLSSMFLAGENQPTAFPWVDYRPEVHDSDGLQIHAANGEWLWRPLHNPRRPFVTSFSLASPRGFGLMQRDRAFSSYEDLEAHYERRPSAWVEPVGDWGGGRVELLQFHTPDETHDNVAAYWVPARLPPAGEPLELAWRLHWAGDDAPAPPGARVLQTRRGHGWRDTPPSPGQLQYHVDYGPSLEGLPADAGVEAVASGDDNVRALRAVAYPNPARGGWRVTLDVERVDAERPVELRLFLRQADRSLSETWTHALPPE